MKFLFLNEMKVRFPGPQKRGTGGTLDGMRFLFLDEMKVRFPGPQKRGTGGTLDGMRFLFLNEMKVRSPVPGGEGSFDFAQDGHPQYGSWGVGTEATRQKT